MAKCNVWRTLLADGARQSSGVDATNGDAATGCEPRCQLILRPPVGWICWIPFYNHASRKRICGFIIFCCGASISNMWKCEGYDLASIGGISHDLLIARHSCIKAKLSDGGSDSAKPMAIKNGSVRKHEASSRFLV